MIIYIKDTRIYHRNLRTILQLVIFLAVILRGWAFFDLRSIPASPVYPRTARFASTAPRAGKGAGAALHGKENGNLTVTGLLNQDLYQLLYDLTDGEVNVVDKGQELRYAVVERNGRRGIQRHSGGEEYQINCPICGDKRKRCFVNHTFGTRIEGIPVYHLVHCFNEECDREISKWLREAMKDSGMNGRIATKGKKTTSIFDIMQEAQSSAKNHVQLPMVSPLTDLHPDHEALKYLRERGFEAEYLVRCFNVGFFKGLPTRPRWENKRLIIPIVFSGMRVGSTARLIPGYTPPPWPTGGEPPKYFHSPGFKKSWFLYNYDQAKNSPVIAVVEGVTDVWKIGTWGMALLGKSMSDQQCQLLCQAGEKTGAWIVLLGDASTEKDNAAASWRRNYEKLKAAYRYPDRVFLHHMAKGDPGDCSSRELYDLVNNIIYRRKTQ